MRMFLECINKPEKAGCIRNVLYTINKTRSNKPILFYLIDKDLHLARVNCAFNVLSCENSLRLSYTALSSIKSIAASAIFSRTFGKTAQTKLDAILIKRQVLCKDS